MALGTTAAIILGTTALAGTAGISHAISSSASKKADKKARQATEQAQKTAEQKSLMETSQEDKTNKARQSLLDTPTSGFGPNTNLARSFLTTL